MCKTKRAGVRKCSKRNRKPTLREVREASSYVKEDQGSEKPRRETVYVTQNGRIKGHMRRERIPFQEKWKKRSCEGIKCNMTVGAQGRDLLKIKIQRYIGDTMVTIDISVCMGKSAVRERTIKNGVIGKQ